MKDFVWLVAGGVATELIVMGVVKLWGEMKFLSKRFWLTAFLAALAISLSVVMTSLYFYTQTPRGIDDCAETNAGSNVVAVAEFQRARASFQRNAGLFAIAREGCLSGLQRGS